MTQRISVSSMTISSRTPIGMASSAPTPSGSTSRQTRRRTAVTTIGTVRSESTTSSRTTAVGGSVSALATGTKIMAAPKPEKPADHPGDHPGDHRGDDEAGENVSGDRLADQLQHSP